MKAKARLVLQGHSEPDLGNTPVASPTMSRDGYPIVFQMVASNGWRLNAADIRGTRMYSRQLSRDSGPLYARLPSL